VLQQQLQWRYLRRIVSLPIRGRLTRDGQGPVRGAPGRARNALDQSEQTVVLTCDAGGFACGRGANFAPCEGDRACNTSSDGPLCSDPPRAIIRPANGRREEL